MDIGQSYVRASSDHHQMWCLGTCHTPSLQSGQFLFKKRFTGASLQQASRRPGAWHEHGTSRFGFSTKFSFRPIQIHASREMLGCAGRPVKPFLFKILNLFLLVFCFLRYRRFAIPCPLCVGHDIPVRQHYKVEHWAHCHNHTPS